jgi:OOP family OmpA-OmpF porin
MLRKLLLFLFILFAILILVWWLPQCSQVAKPRPAPEQPATKNKLPEASAAAGQEDSHQPDIETSTSKPVADSDQTEPSGEDKASATAPLAPRQDTEQEERETPPEATTESEENTSLATDEVSTVGGSSEETGKPDEAATTETIEPENGSEVISPATDPAEPAPLPTATENPAPAKEDASSPQSQETSEKISTIEANTIESPPVAGEGAASAAELLLHTLTPTAEHGSATIILDGVSFAYDSDQLTEDSDSVLDNVITSLQRNPEVRLEIAGYTDDRGEALYNRILSRRRAEAVMIYLVTKGINAERLTAVGYGSDDPIADNATAAGRQKNRRVELHIK